jgi:hypothetical protein
MRAPQISPLTGASRKWIRLENGFSAVLGVLTRAELTARALIGCCAYLLIDGELLAPKMAYRPHVVSLIANNAADVSKRANKPLTMLHAQKLNRKPCTPDDQIEHRCGHLTFSNTEMLSRRVW